jgi:hypothetical protein
MWILFLNDCVFHISLLLFYRSVHKNVLRKLNFSQFKLNGVCPQRYLQDVLKSAYCYVVEFVHHCS